MVREGNTINAKPRDRAHHAEEGIYLLQAEVRQAFQSNPYFSKFTHIPVIKNTTDTAMHTGHNI